jgi:hypothetical protein
MGKQLKVLVIFNIRGFLHYKISRFFKRFNLTKMFTLTKNMGHEKHMVILVGFFD